MCATAVQGCESRRPRRLAATPTTNGAGDDRARVCVCVRDGEEVFFARLRVDDDDDDVRRRGIAGEEMRRDEGSTTIIHPSS